MFNKEIYNYYMMKIGDSAQSPDEIAKTFPIENVSYDDIFEVLAEAIQKKGYGHYGCFFKTDFRQLVCFRGEVYELCDNNWVERKLYKDINDKWHLKDI